MLVYSEERLDPRRVVLYDGINTLRGGQQTLTLSGFDVDSTPSGDLTFYALEGESHSGMYAGFYEGIEVAATCAAARPKAAAVAPSAARSAPPPAWRWRWPSGSWG